MRECPRCGEAVAVDAEACAACGAVLRSIECERHPGRQAVAACVVCGRALCEACDAGEERASLCAEHSGVPVIQGWAQVYSTGDEIEAQLIEDNLRAEGIEARVFSQKDHAFAIGMGDLSPVRILVPAFSYIDAQTVIRAHMDERGELDFESEPSD